MRKGDKQKELSLERGPRKALLRSLTRALVLKERIRTTEAKAKAVSRLAEKYITKAKRGDLASRFWLLARLEPKLVGKMTEELAPRYKQRNGGYTRIFKLGPRLSNAARMAIVELVK